MADSNTPAKSGQDQQTSIAAEKKSDVSDILGKTLEATEAVQKRSRRVKKLTAKAMAAEADRSKHGKRNAWKLHEKLALEAKALDNEIQSLPVSPAAVQAPKPAASRQSTLEIALGTDKGKQRVPPPSAAKRSRQDQSTLNAILVQRHATGTTRTYETWQRTCFRWMSMRDVSEAQMRADTDGRLHLEFLAWLSSPEYTAWRYGGQTRRPPLAPGTVAQAGIAVRDYFRVESWKQSALFKDFNKGLRHLQHRPPRPKLAFRLRWLTRLIRHLDDIGRGSALDAITVVALLAVGFHAALRRSELVALDIGDISFHKARSQGVVYKYAEVHIRKSKTDQGAAGQTVVVVRTSHVTSAYTWLRRLLSRYPRGSPADTPLFALGGVRLPASDVANLVKDVVRRFSSFNPDDLAGHSLRRGGLTALSCAGAPLPVVQRLARHRDPASTAAYIVPPLHIYAEAQLAM